MNSETLISQIQKFSVNDGPGFRTNVYLKGCPLHCAWCHNPETQSFGREIYWKTRLCVQCGECLEACPSEAINPPIAPEEAQKENSTYQKIITEKCDLCFKCVEACQYNALEIVGEPMSIDQILKEVEQDRVFYNNSGGGMTLSGGEPTAHGEFALKLLDAAKSRKLHLCLDTSGFCQWDILKQFVAKVDLVLYDLKHLDSKLHLKMTGVPNEPILDNLKKLTGTDCQIWLRILVIPDFSETIEYHRDVVKYLLTLPRKVDRIDLLPYHNWCEDKYKWLGRKWLMADYQAIDPVEVEILKDIYEMAGFNVTVGGSGFEN
ncbi:MAG TPA: glycyl-radical enzyme activating protein [Desulfobacteraceae bacterium]|nr:glycyl-radical enzyme activating protein [Desulfobacteraceae bacterium]